MIVAIVIIIFFAHRTDFLNSANQVPEKEVEEKVIAKTTAGKVFEKRTEKIRNKKNSVMAVDVFEEKKFNEQNSIIKKIEKDCSRQK